MSQSMPLPLTVSCFSEIKIGFTVLPVWYRLTLVVPEKGQLNVCVVCITVGIPNKYGTRYVHVSLLPSSFPGTVDIVRY